MRALNVFLAFLVSGLIGLAVLEGGLRLLGFGPPKNLLTFDAACGWAKKPNASQHKRGPEFDVHLRTNELGLRDDPMDGPAKPAGSYRVLALGDSFTQGWSVSRDDLFVDILERWWQAEGRKVDVVNAGTEGWSTDQEVAWFLEHGADFQPDLVLVFAYENDLYWCAETQYPPDLDKPRFTPQGELEDHPIVDHAGQTLTDDFALTRILFKKKTDAERFAFVPEGGERPISKEFGALLKQPPAFMQDATSRAGGALRALKARCDELGAQVVLVPIPSHSLVDEEYAAGKFTELALGGLAREAWSPDAPVDTFLSLAEGAGIGTLDPRATLRAIAKSEPIYFERDWHFNPAGNAVFARFLKSELEGFLPGSHKAVTVVDDPSSTLSASTSGGVPFALKLFLVLWIVLTGLYIATYRDEPAWQPPFKVAGLLALVFAIFIGARKLIALVPPQFSAVLFAALVGGVLIFVAYKLGRRLSTIAELMKSFTLRGHWYLMPLIVVLLTVGSLLVVAASSPLVAPFIYTLF